MAVPGVFIGDHSIGGIGELSLPVRSRGEAPVGVSRRWSSLQTMVTDFDCKNDQNFFLEI